MSVGFLGTVIAEIRRSIASGEYDRTAEASRPGDRSGLARAVAGRPAGELGLIVEYKLASPGRTPPQLPRRTVEEFLARTDLPAVVGYSCLATGPRFHGSPEQVAAIAQRTPRPVLFKDFVLDRRQLVAAARTGARAVLLIARLESEGLLDEPLAELGREAHRLGLETLLELHRPEEIALARSVPCDLVGVNVRDLDTLAIDRSTGFETLERLRGTLEVPTVGLSGVETPDDARAFAERGCDAVLVGSAVALADDPGAFLRSLAAGGRIR